MPMDKQRKETLAILPGSYDPITKGHVALVERASHLFDRVVVAVMHNEAKTYTYTAEQRLALVRASVAHVENCTAIVDHGMLVDLYRRLDASCVVKGLRNERDYLYEEKQAKWNREHCEGFETLYFAADDGLAAISSTEVRRRLSAGLDCADLLMPNAEAMIRSGEILKIVTTD